MTKISYLTSICLSNLFKLIVQNNHVRVCGSEQIHHFQLCMEKVENHPKHGSKSKQSDDINYQGPEG
jgi:hypothetical protein